VSEPLRLFVAAGGELVVGPPMPPAETYHHQDLGGALLYREGVVCGWLRGDRTLRVGTFPDWELNHDVRSRIEPQLATWADAERTTVEFVATPAGDQWWVPSQK
jgi:hypothetical protein